MYRWITTNSGSICVYDFPDLEQLFHGHGSIYRWATPSCIVFNSTTLAFIMPIEPISGDTHHFSVRQLDQAELNDPLEKFASILLQVRL